MKRKVIRLGLIILGSFFTLGLLFYFSVASGMWGTLPGEKTLENLEYKKATEVYSADSVLIGKFYRYDRQPISYDKLPPHLTHALIAIEDERYYEHQGVDWKSLGRVLVKTLLLQDASSGGGSTLSQQLVKNLYPRTGGGKIRLAADKLKEMIVARRLESIYSKEELLEHYLNTVSFGDNTYGIESASLKFYNKPAAALKVQEAATLIGMLKATYGYNPRVFPERSLGRRNLVLEAMVRNNYLEESKADSLKVLELGLDYRDYGHDDGIAPYFREAVRGQLLQWADSSEVLKDRMELYTSGLKIYTTLNYKMQQAAEVAMQKHMKELQAAFEKAHGTSPPWKRNKQLLIKLAKRTPEYKKLQAAGLKENEILDSMQVERQLRLIDWEGEKEITGSSMDSIRHYMKFLNVGSLGIDPSSGAVLTWIGGANFKAFKFDHVSQGTRQVGSVFKPILYAAALEEGIDPCDHISAREVAYENFDGWSPSNSGEEDEAYLNYSMEEALANSVNTVAVKLMEQTGISNVVAQARGMGIRGELPNEPSLALGTASLTPLEMAKAYSSFINHGTPVEPYLIRAVYSDQDSLLMSFKPSTEARPAFSETTRQVMLELMQSVVDRGTASRLRSVYGIRSDIAGKTGTTQNNKDAWFVALNPKLVHVSWVGLDNHEIGFPSTRLGQGANAALPLFALFFRELQKQEMNDITSAGFSPPGPVAREMIDCEPVKKDGFFKRLFTNPDKKKKKKFRRKEGG